MLCNSRKVALKYTPTPYLICSSKEPASEVYYVPEGSLPALSLPDCDPLSLVTPEQIFALKRRYRTPNTLIKKMQKCYKEGNDEFDLDEDLTVENSLFINSVEDIILNTLKRTYRDESANYLPHYPREDMGLRTYMTTVLGSSSSGKSYTTSLILSNSFKDCIIYIWSPTASKDPAWTKLRDREGKRVKLINSNEVELDIPLSEIVGGSCHVFDDMDSTQEPARTFLQRLQSRLLFEGRHHVDKNGIGCCVFSVCHDAFSVNSPALKAAAVESSRLICFPRVNRSICKKYFQKRLHWGAKEIREVMNFVQSNDRWACIYSHVPNLVVCPHGVKLLS